MAFATEAHGRTYKLDKNGNEMVAAAMKNGTIKSDEDGDVHVNPQFPARHYPGIQLRIESVQFGLVPDIALYREFPELTVPIVQPFGRRQSSSLE